MHGIHLKVTEITREICFVNNNIDCRLVATERAREVAPADNEVTLTMFSTPFRLYACTYPSTDFTMAADLQGFILLRQTAVRNTRDFPVIKFRDDLHCSEERSMYHRSASSQSTFGGSRTSCPRCWLSKLEPIAKVFNPLTVGFYSEIYRIKKRNMQHAARKKTVTVASVRLTVPRGVSCWRQPTAHYNFPIQVIQ